MPASRYTNFTVPFRFRTIYRRWRDGGRETAGVVRATTGDAVGGAGVVDVFAADVAFGFMKATGFYDKSKRSLLQNETTVYKMKASKPLCDLHERKA